MAHATDTGVVVIAVAVSNILQNCEVWIAFGYDNKLRYIPWDRTANKLGTDASCGLLFFHAVSGCDTVSAFRGVGKKTDRDIWCSMSHLDQIFARLSHAPKQIFTEDLKQLEKVFFSCAFSILYFHPSWLVSLVVIFCYKFRVLRFYFSAQQGSNIRGRGGCLNESLFVGEHLFPLYLCLLDWDEKERGCMLLGYLVYYFV